MLHRRVVLAVVIATTVCSAFATTSNRIGDVNADGVVDAGDVSYLTSYLLGDGAAPNGPADVNGDAAVNLLDAFYLMNYVYAGGPPPVCVAPANQACNTGLSGICSAGTVTCSNGALVCTQNQQPQPETCNGLDDNCNGSSDEGNPGGGQACNTGKPGVCAQGTTNCVNGNIACSQNQQPSMERCGNNLDDDCNGQVDEPGCGCYVPSDCGQDTSICKTWVCNYNTCEINFAPNGFDCITDGNPCTLNDTCDGNGTCRGRPIVCDDNDPCTTDTCSNGQCSSVPLTCDDHIDCTIDSCSANDGCVHTANDAICDDNDPSTIDKCDLLIGCTHTKNSAASCDTGLPGICAERVISCSEELSCNSVPSTASRGVQRTR